MTRVVHLRLEPYDVRIDRRSKWGNPFKIDKTAPDQDAERARVIAAYREWLHDPEQAELCEQAQQQLRGKVLGCWCKPEACHGDVLVELLAVYR